jgi:hypothetical protein
MKFFEKFDGNNVEVMRDFSQSFDGEEAQVGNLMLHIYEHLLSQIIGLPQTDEKWFKNKPMEMKPWTPFLLRNRKIT